MSAPTSPTRLDHVGALDGLRGLAVAGVILHHLDRLDGGFLGVDLFFVLSGFLITSLLLVEHDRSGRVSLRAFWERRGRRLLPAMLVLVASVSVYAATIARPDELARLRRESFGALFYVSNWVQLAAGEEYFERFARPSLLRHFWSLAIEEQFYLLWPLIVVAILARTRQPARLLGVVCAVGALASFAWAMILYDPDASTLRLYYGTDTRIGAILAGGAAACIIDRWRARREEDAPNSISTWIWLGAGVGVGLLAAGWISMSGDSTLLWRGGLALMSVAAAVVVGVIGTGADNPLSGALSLAPLRWLGWISYGLYLWHWPVIVVLDGSRTGLDGWALDALRIAVSIGLAVASARFIERPVRFGALTGQTLLRGGAVAMVAVSVLVLWGTRPVEEVAGPTLVGAEDLGITPVEDREGTSTTTVAGASEMTTSTIVAPTEPLSLVVVGDSVGHNFGQAAERMGERFGFAARDSAVVGCPLVQEPVQTRWSDGRVVTTDSQCSDWDLRWALNIGDIEANTVLMVFGAAAQTETEVRPGVWASPCDAEYDRFWRDNLEAALDVLEEQDVEIGVATVPYFRGASEEERLDLETDCLNRELVAAVSDRDEVALVDLAEWVCPEGVCRTEVQGVELRPDGLHFSDATAEVALNWALTDLLGPWSTRVGGASTTTVPTTSTTSAGG